MILQKLLDYIDTMPFIGSPEHSNLVNVIQQEFMPIEKETDDEWVRMECEIKSLQKSLASKQGEVNILLKESEKYIDEIEDLRETLDRYVLMCEQYKARINKLEKGIQELMPHIVLQEQYHAKQLLK